MVAEMSCTMTVNKEGLSHALKHLNLFAQECLDAEN